MSSFLHSILRHCRLKWCLDLQSLTNSLGWVGLSCANPVFLVAWRGSFFFSNVELGGTYWDMLIRDRMG
jgi:hypothetical protein